MTIQHEGADDLKAGEGVPFTGFGEPSARVTLAAEKNEPDGGEGQVHWSEVSSHLLARNQP